MKRTLSLFSALLFVVAMTAPARAISTSASCAILMDAGSGRILYAQNIHEPRLIASITKLMTALVAVENSGDLDREVTILPEWLGSEGSSIYLKAGEKITLKGLLYGLLLQSGNDAAMAIACHVAGDMDSFVELMNQRAEELGMANTSFANPSGLNDDDHYSTAYDMALLACACLENEVIAQICATQSATVGTRTFYNHNKLLHRYEGCVGMKTGYTQLAGRTLVSAATRNGMTLVCVTLNDSNDWEDHERLLNYGFETYRNEVLCDYQSYFGSVKVSGSLVPAVPVITAGHLTYPLAEGETLEMTMEIAHDLQAPFSAGMKVGWIVWTLNGEPVAETELVCISGTELNLYAPEGLRQRIQRLFDRYTLAPDGAHLI